jgi:hypothetical protein
LRRGRGAEGPTVPGSPAELLLGSLSARAEPALSDSVRPISPGVWYEIADIAIRHDVAPLLFKRLKQSDARTRVPADVWERLRLNYLVGAGRNARLHRWLGPVLGGLRRAGIPVIVLKGAFLAEAVYGDIALRPMCDVDLLVSKEEMPRTRAALLDMGGVCMEPAHHAAPTPGGWRQDIESLCRSESHLPAVVFHHLIVEVHWTLASPTEPVRVDAAGLWHRARPATIAGVEVLALSPEDLLLHLCLHVCCRHRLDASLLSFCDITETIHRYRGRMDWDQVVRTAREWGATRHAGLAFHLAGRLLGASVPDDVFRRLLPGGSNQRVLEMASESFAARLSIPVSVSRSVRDLWGVKSLADRAKIVWGRIFLSREEMAELYPKSRNAKHLCFYYAHRFRDVLAMHGASVPRVMLSRDIRQRASKMAAVSEWLDSGRQ